MGVMHPFLLPWHPTPLLLQIPHVHIRQAFKSWFSLETKSESQSEVTPSLMTYRCTLKTRLLGLQAEVDILKQ